MKYQALKFMKMNSKELARKRFKNWKKFLERKVTDIFN